MYKISTLTIFILGLFLFTGCEEEPDTKFDIVESPVLAVFEGQSFTADEPISISAIFYELDKSGILDSSVGIDSSAISGLNIELFINEDDKIADFVTDGDGEILAETSWTALGGVSPVIRLEWVGNYNNQAFRIYHTIGLIED